MSTRAVLFDMDGTLVDSVLQHAQAWQAALAAFGHPIDLRRIRKQIGKGGDQLMPHFLRPSDRRSHGREIEAYRLATFRAKYLPRLRAFAGVRALFLRLKADGWQVALVSSSNREDLRICIRLCRIGSLIDVVTSTDDASRSKPAPDILLAAHRRLPAIPPARCLVIGDSPYDHAAARKAGMCSIGVLSGHFSRASLRAAGATAVYRDPADLLRHYREWAID